MRDGINPDQRTRTCVRAGLHLGVLPRDESAQAHLRAVLDDDSHFFGFRYAESSRGANRTPSPRSTAEVVSLIVPY